MTVRYGSCLRQPRKGGSWYVCVIQRGDGRERRIIHSAHEYRHDADIARRAILHDLAAHWREPGKRGPKPASVRWETSIRHIASGWRVSLARVARDGRRRSAVIAVHTIEADAAAHRERIRLDPETHWREPQQRSQRSRESQQRAAARRVMREPVPAPVEPQPEPVGERWLLGCGIHDAARPVHPCPVCAQAAELTAASLEVVARHRYGWAVVRARLETA